MPPILIEKQKNKWVVFPDSLPGGRFKGYETDEDATQNRGVFPVGQNITFDSSYIPTVRSGYEVIGTEASDATPVKRGWVYETREGVQIEVKTYSTKMDFWIHGTSTTWLLLKGGFTSGKEFAFANIGQSDQTTAWCFFGNGVENPYRWTGAFALIASTTGTTITKTGSTTWTAEGFPATGTVIINGTEYSYTGGAGTTTLTGVTGNPTGEANGSIVMASPVELTGVIGGGLDPRKFAVAMAHDGRLHYRAEAKKSVWDYSKLDDPDNVTTGSSDGDGGAKDVEFGGPITSFGKLNKAILAFKKRLIKVLTFNQVGSRLDSPVYTTLISADDKSTSLGANNQKSTFSTPQGIVFVTPDKRMVLLTGVTANSEPQYLFLSDSIQPVFNQGVHDEATGICVDNIIWYAFKSDVDSTYNDVVLRGDMTHQTANSDGKIIPVVWDTPYIGWNVNDWTAIYNSTLEKNEIHWHSSLNSNSYKLITDKTDNTLPFTSIIRTWAEDFGASQLQKKADYLYLEVLMTENTELTATLLYDEEGVTQQKEYVLNGTDPQIFNSSVYNPFGASPFGFRQIGSNPADSTLKKFRYWLETDNNVWFFNLSLQLSTEEAGNDFSLIRWGVRITKVAEDMDLKYKSG